ncbi:MAG: TonB-dependent receptor [Bacteroidota bacterium]
MKIKSLWLMLLTVFLTSSSGLAQNTKVTLSGYVKEAASGETLIGATVYIKELQNGTTTNEYGFYSLSVPQGTYQIDVSYIGFENQLQTVDLRMNTKLDFDMGASSQQLVEVVVTSEAEDVNITNTEMSVNKVSIATIEKMPALLGEVDVVRSIQLLPGVSTVGEGATGFNVRGGSIDQNLILLDEAPVYNSSHLFGFFSVFNPDAVKDVKLYKGGIPARYGGRLSSILDVRMKEGNMKKYEVNGGVGLIFSRLSVEGPIKKDKASFIVAGRRSYIDVIARPIIEQQVGGDTKLNFYDLTLKTNYKIDDNDRIYLSGYLGRDNFGFGNQAGFSWGNQTATLRWNHLFSEQLFSNFTAFFSNYDYEINFGLDSDNTFDWSANIKNYSLKSDFSYFLNPDNLITFGGQAVLYNFAPANAFSNNDGENLDFSLDDKYALETGLFIENEQKISNRISLQYGVRWSFFNYMGEGTAYEFEEAEAPGERRFPITSATRTFDQWESIQTYNNFEPRFSIKYQLDPTTSLKASYNRTAQYIHLVSNTTAATPVDVWTPSTNNIKPQTAHQVALGLFKNFKDNTYITSLEGYFKPYRNLLEFVDGADLLLNEFLEGELFSAKGRAYGAELQIEKKKGDFTGWMSYTLSRSERQADGINNGEWFPSRFDQTHSFSTTAFYELNKRWSFSANFVLNSGTPTTFATSRVELQGYVIPHVFNEKRNNVRIPLYHRLDVSATLKGKEKPGKKLKGEWVFSIYNLYNRRNPFSIYFREDRIRTPQGTPINTNAIRFSVIGSLIPSVAYNFKF